MYAIVNSGMVVANSGNDDSDIYYSSTIVEKLRKAKEQNKRLHIAFLDIDSTMTGSINSTNATRRQLETLGYTIVYVTSRTEEMLMSKKTYDASVRTGFDRPRPLLERSHNTFSYIPPEEFEPEGLLDPDIIAGSTGSQILLKQPQGNYLLDHMYEKTFCAPSHQWREEALALIQHINKDQPLAYLSPYEYPENYEKRLVNIYQPKFRVVLNFNSSKDKRQFSKKFTQLREVASDSLPFDANTMHLTDDSHPRKKLFTLCLTPRFGYKTTAVEHIVHMLSRTLAVDRSEFHLLIAGDSFPDMDMGLRGGKGTHATFVIAGGSRLTLAFADKLNEDPTIEQTILTSNKFIGGKNHGYYNYTGADNSVRRVIIADEVCHDKKEVDSILTILKAIE